jgi:hypothetical protein
MTAAQIRAVRIERTASLDDTLRAMLEILQEIAAQLAEALHALLREIGADPVPEEREKDEPHTAPESEEWEAGRQ